MISYVSGILSEIEENYIVVEAGGVGYGINIPSTLFQKLPGIGSTVKLYTHLQIAEDARKLYGFLSKEERELFRMLISVSSVGPKAAIAVLSVLTPDELRLAVLSEDEKAIARAQGLGSKTAKKIILELKDKFGAADMSGLFAGATAGATKADKAQVTAREDTIAALTSLGYSASEALAAITKVADAASLTSDQLLKEALKKLV